jgi:Spy/CpxP family protein refolding chaperone
MTWSFRLAALGLLLGLGATAFGQPPGGFPGGFERPQPGQILPGIFQQQLNLTPEQKKQLDELQKEVDAKLAKILTPEQRERLRDLPGGFGPGGFPGGGFGGPGGFPGGGGGFGGPGGGGGFGGQRGNRLDAAKRLLAASDEEWKVIQPKLEKVIALRQALAGDSPGGAMFGPGGFGAPTGGGSTTTNGLTQAQADLRALLAEAKRSAADVEQKVAAVRQARRKVRDELDAAQKDLLKLLTAEQEAALVGLGHID